MSDQKCDVCEEDPGPGTICQHCGGRQYRYATDELYGDDQPPPDAIDQDDQVARALRERREDMENIGATERRAARYDSSDAWSVGQQAAAIDHLEHPNAGPMSSEEKNGGGCLRAFLVIIAIGAVALGIGIFLIAKNADSIEDFFDELVTEATVDTSAFLDPVDLESWDEVVVGDCFNEDRDENGIYPPIIVDCRNSHDGEFFFIGSLLYAEWPGTEVASSSSNSLCIEEFPDYVGVEYSESLWYSNGLYPSEQQWAEGDQTFHCYVYLPDTTSSERAESSHK